MVLVVVGMKASVGEGKETAGICCRVVAGMWGGVGGCCELGVLWTGLREAGRRCRFHGCTHSGESSTRKPA